MPLPPAALDLSVYQPPGAPNMAWKGTLPVQLSPDAAAGIEKYF